MTSTTDNDDDDGHIRHLKEHAKRTGFPWQVMHGTAPQEMMNEPEKYNWDGTPKAGASFKRPPGEAGGGKLDLAKYRRK